MTKTRVLIIDDSALVRSLLTEIINRQADMEAIGAAPDPYAAREMIRAMNPDVLTLDVEMPKMDGLDFLEKLMRLRPTPVVMVSTLTARGAEVTIRALELGAIDFVAKPKIGIATGLQDLGAEICEKIRVASRARMHRHAMPARAPTPVDGAAKVRPAHFSRLSTEKLIAIGASTGGTEAIREILQRLPADSPAVLVTQHMPPGFTKSFAARLDGVCRITVTEAVHGERALPGHAYIAPGDRHLRLERSGANYLIALDDGEPVNRHRPSVDVLFRSVAHAAGPNALGTILTGMGKDGALGLLEMRNAGSYTIAQDEASCIVYGMPREAVAAGAVEDVLPLNAIAERLLAKLASHGEVAHRV
ncbi:MAG TPA: chemotaxis response regulator protein-glutamate methylesterase [Burkholderiaceae bacterium]|nr:chemotaxis response regulator protein-glutamate methylesterase [Burkholderiaceae bacterium]